MQNEVLGFIDDGYTEQGFVRGEPGLHPDVRFEWRPSVPEELDRYNADADRLKGTELRKHAARFLAAKLVSWDLRNGKGDVVPISLPNVLRLKDGLFMHLLRVTLGIRASDVDPRWDEERRRREEADREAAEAAGQPLHAWQQERDRKN